MGGRPLAPTASIALAAIALLCGSARAQTDVAAGQAFFERICAACHQAGGQGQAGLAPALAGPLAPLLAQEEGRRYVLQVLLNGLSGRIVSQGQVLNLAMPSQGGYADTELAEVARYVARLKGSSATFAPEDVARARATPVTHKQMRELRERLLK